MLVDSLHREDIKAILRKRHSTLKRFAETKGVKEQAIADFLRGRTSAGVADLIEAELQAAHKEELVPSMKLDDSSDDSDAHRLNSGAR